ncbi:uncharacterized protein LOC128995883 [Macrosteles quadrilineatus]|uniref:uncharacterized protein LOC128995883 n=1 Tax=Macrosteles quadrilineatus TaxID=74068 RepID=UPI0023E1EA86|nr:uncharacterized protein LOC128995883 [Macrosteles quadrilineatus]
MMELDNFLYKIQGVLKTEEKLIGPLYNIKKENEEEYSKLEASLKKAITGRPPDTNHRVEVQLYILLFLNTDISLYNDLKKNRKCAHLVGFFPKISQDLFIKLTLGLKLNIYLYESVKHFNSSLSVEVADICLKSLKWIDLFEAVNLTENLIISLFSKIVETDETDKYYSHLKDVFQRLLLHYDAEKGGSVKRMGSWKKSKLKHYAGLVMASLLELVHQCSKIYLKKNDNDDSIDYSLFSIQIDNDSFDLKHLPDVSTSGSITLQQCYEHIVARCLQNVSDITLDIWLFWLEIDLDEIPDTENTLQKLVGEKAFKCQEALKEAECSGLSSKESSELLNRLTNIAIKPSTEEDLAASLDLEKVLNNINDPEKDSAKWLKYLISNPDFVVDPSALDVLASRVNNLESNDVLKLYKTIFEHLIHTPDSLHHKTFIFETIKQCSVNVLPEVSNVFVEVCGISDFLKQEDFQSTMVETFNMVINEEDKEKELMPMFVSLALQDAAALLKRAVSEGITSEVRGHLMAGILGQLHPFCHTIRSTPRTLLIEALDELLVALPDLPESQRINYPFFVRELVMRTILPGEQFIQHCLMGKLFTHMKTENWVVMSVCLETLTELLDIGCVHNCPATIMMLMQVVEASRCQPNNYTVAATQVCQQALHLVSMYVSKWHDQGLDEKQLSNLKLMVRQHISPLNRFHLYRLMDEPVPSDSALRLMYYTHYGIGEWSVSQITPDERLMLVYALCFVLPTLTVGEWREMFCVVAPKCSEFLILFNIVTEPIH